LISSQIESSAYPELVAGHDGERAGFGRDGDPAPVPDLHLEASHLVLREHRGHVLVAVRAQGDAGLLVRRRPVERHPDEVGQRPEVRGNALVTGPQALEDQPLHRLLQFQHVLGELYDRVTGTNR
jgi:hypothetical protein